MTSKNLIYLLIAMPLINCLDLDMRDSLKFEATNKLLSPDNANVQNDILHHHNSFRGIVDPPASNMLRMKWHSKAARAAQAWADQCSREKDASVSVERYGQCGQNVMITTDRVSWYYPISEWFAKRQFFNYGSFENKPEEVESYTQLVWATSHKVGCGIAICDNTNSSAGSVFYNFVCNYCPRGNYYYDRPYKNGTWCGSCPNSCYNHGLCTNPCPYENRWRDCEQLMPPVKNESCVVSELDSREILHNCKATCSCRELGQIYEADE